MLEKGNLEGRGVDDTVEVGQGHLGGCKGRSDIGGMFRREVCGGQTELKGKKPKYDGNGCGKDPGNGGGWFSGSGREGNIGGKGDGCVVGRDGEARRAMTQSEV